MKTEPKNQPTKREKFIAELKKEFGELFEVEIAVDDEETDIAFAYIMRPPLPVVKAAMSIIDENPVGACMIVFDSCFIKEHSDPRFLTDQDLKLSLLPLLEQSILVRKAKLEKSTGDEYKIIVPVDDIGIEKVTAVVKKPTFEQISKAVARQKKDPVGAYINLFKTCAVKEKTDPLFYSSDDVQLSACNAIQQLMKIRQGTLKKI